MKKTQIILVIILVLIAAYYAWTAMLYKQRSDDVLSKFKELDSSLATIHDSTITKEKGLDAIQETFTMASAKTGLILLIDSLKDDYQTVSKDVRTFKTSKQIHADLKRLLLQIRAYNLLNKDATSSGNPDTIKFHSSINKFNEQKWIADHFENVRKEVSITYLNYLRNQVIPAQ